MEARVGVDREDADLVVADGERRHVGLGGLGDEELPLHLRLDVLGQPDAKREREPLHLSSTSRPAAVASGLAAAHGMRADSQSPRTRRTLRPVCSA